MPPENVWETIKLIRTEFDSYGKAQGVEIRWKKSDRGIISFSYACGIVIEKENPDGSDLFKSFKFIPDRFIYEYIKLLQEASSIIHSTMRDSERNEDGFLTAKLLEDAIVSNVRRRRVRPVT